MRCYHHANAPATTVCLGCFRALCEVCARRHEHFCERRHQPSQVLESLDQPCRDHAFEPARGVCSTCHRPICLRCAETIDGQTTCHDCARRASVPQSIVPRPPRQVRSRQWLLEMLGVVAIAVLIALVALVGAGVVALPRGVNAQAGATGTAAPIDLVQRHCADLAAGEYEAAWQQLSPSAQKLVEFTSWADSYAGFRIEPSKLEVASQSSTSAVVVGDVTITAGSLAPTAGRGPWTLTLVDSAWRIDSIIFTSATSSSASR